MVMSELPDTLKKTSSCGAMSTKPEGGDRLRHGICSPCLRAERKTMIAVYQSLAPFGKPLFPARRTG